MQDDVAGRYRLDERIGSGGMAEVWRATDTRTGATVAVKRLHPGLADDVAARSRFRREIEASRAVAHPAAVRVLDADPDADPPWLVMEHVAGGSLAARLEPGAPMPADAVARIGADVAGALAALHAAGLVHRDVTPSNILLPPDGGARLADFGIARTWDGSPLEDVTLTGDVVGTLRFVAPEILAGGPAGPAADVWALGAVLHEAGTGRRPFDASSPAALLASQRRLPPMDGIDPASAPLLTRMLDPDPSARPAATAVAAALSRIADHVTTERRPDAIAEEGTVVMASAVPSRAAGVDVEPVAIGSIPGAVPERQLSPPRARRRPPARARRAGVPAPAVLAVGLLLLAAVVLGASSFGGPAAGEPTPAPPAVVVEATPAPTVTAAPAEQGGDAGPGSKDKDKGKGKGNGGGNGNGRGG
jgi:serine/threonine-protein kinase